MTDKTNWKIVKFGDVVRLNRDRVADPEAESIERYVGIEHIEPEDLRIRSWGLVEEGTSFTNYFQPGQVLFVKRRAYQRKVAVAEFSGVCSGDIYVLEPKDPAVLLPELLPFICQTERFYQHAVGTSAGSLSPRTNWTQLSKYEFPLPPLAEQRRLAEVLWAAQANVEASSNLVTHAQILFSSFVKTQFEKYSKQYPLCFVPEITERTTVGIVVRPSDWYVENGEGIPALRSLNVLPGRLDFSDIVHITEEGHSIHTKSQLSPGDVVVVRSGRPGDAVAIPEGIGPLNCIDLVIATPNKNMIGEYLAAFLNSPQGILQFIAGTAGTAQKHFNVSAFNKVKVPLPPIEVQKDLVDELIEIKQVQNNVKMRREANLQLQKQFLNQALANCL